MNEQSWTDKEIDRSKWGEGPWDGEPDKVQWKDDATGMDCLAKRNGWSGNWCGYVGLQPGHRFHGKSYDEVRFDGEDPYPDVHGGLTYADGCEHSSDPAKGICHIPAPGEPDALWWLGFDCHHGVYQDAPPDVEGRRVYLLDFSYKRPVVEAMLDKAESITLIDHHKTALDDLEPIMGRMRCHCGLDHSGAMLAWQFVQADREPPALLRHIEDRDLWRFALPHTREIQANVFSHPYDFAVWDELMHRPIGELVAEGKAIERKHFKDIDELVGVCRHRRVIGGHSVPVASLPYTLTSDAGHLMAKGEPFAACYWDTPSGRVYSLRSTDEGLDVGEVAKGYGGGGHRNASGFRVPYDHPLAGAPA